MKGMQAILIDVVFVSSTEKGNEENKCFNVASENKICVGS